MGSLKTVLLAFFYGLWDSIKGVTLIFYIDEEIYRKNEGREYERQQRMMRRSPSPVPSSASAMFGEEIHRYRPSIRKENPDERRLDSLINKQKPSEVRVPFRQKKIVIKYIKCCVLNGVFTWLSIIMFENLFLPFLYFTLKLIYGEPQDLLIIWGWLQHVLSRIFDVTWILPLFILSKVVSSLWFAEIATEAYRIRKGEPSLMQHTSKLVADFLFNLVVQAIFVVQIMIVYKLPFPYVSKILYYLHLCLLYSLYSFEYKWFNMGWELHKRLNYIEINWPYFMGFGLPLTLLSSMSSSLIVQSCIFSIFFPLFILSGNEAKPIVGSTETPLRVFSVTIYVSNFIFGILTGNKFAQQKHKNYQQNELRHKQKNEAHRGSSNVDNSPTPTQTQYRYPQPPQRISPARLTPERYHRSEVSSSQIRYNESTRTLIPTPITRSIASTTAQSKSTNQRR